ncbi:MAG: HAD family hydrolase [Geobacteraceae bacterium]|nr:HAD family hydrolase [Geobacteraceae bacterium]
MSKPAKYKAVIYDCDGVMFNSLEANCIFYETVFNYMGTSLDRKNVDVMRVIHTYANKEVLRYFFPQKERWEAAIAFAATIDYLKLIHLMEMENGLLETLDTLKGRVSLAVCTNRSSSMEAVLSGFKLTDYFSCIMTASRASFPKPHPDPLLRVLTHYSITAEEAIFIGDSEVDSIAAKAAGIDFISYKADHYGITRIDTHTEILGFI